jgi:HSP20 family molecular chaperone IbpA
MEQQMMKKNGAGPAKDGKQDKGGEEAALAKAQRRFVRPRVDVFESDAEYLLVADVPGAAKDTVDVRFEDGELAIEAPRGAGGASGVLYRRAFALPDGVDADAIDASLANGVLSVRVPKAASRRARRIEIRSA